MRKISGYLTLLVPVLLMLTYRTSEISITPKPGVLPEFSLLSVTWEMPEYQFCFVCRVVYAEAGTEGLTGQILIAQCIYNSLENDIDYNQTITRYGYTSPASTYTKETEQAVRMVFEQGYRYTDEPIKYFYASNLIYSKWHEEQEFVLQYNHVRFFKDPE